MTKPLDHASRSHAPFGGSVAARRINCTGSYFLEAQCPEEPSSPEADEGTKAHECVEYELARFLYFKVHGEYPDDLIEPKHFAEFKDVAIGYREAIWDKVLHQSITGKSYTIESVLVINRALGMYGPADFACVYSDERGRSVGCVVDFKFGYNYVSPEKNDQLAHYACGLREEVRRGGKDLETVKVAIYQPRAGGEIYRETTFTSKFLDSWQKRALKAATQIFIEKKAKFKVGDWCKFCRGKAICKAYAKEASTAAALELVDYKTVELPAVETLGDDQIYKIVIHGDKIEKYIKACRALALQRCSNGNPVAGLKVVEGSGKRSWIEDEVSIVTKLSYYLHVEDFTEQSLLGITKVTSKLKKALKDVGSSGTPEEVLESCTIKSTPKVLVEDSDPRPAVVSSKEMLESIGD